MKLMKKIVAVALTGVMALSVFAGCGAASNNLIGALEDRGFTNIHYNNQLDPDVEAYYVKCDVMVQAEEDYNKDIEGLDPSNDDDYIEIRAAKIRKYNKLEAVSSNFSDGSIYKKIVDKAASTAEDYDEAMSHEGHDDAYSEEDIAELKNKADVAEARLESIEFLHVHYTDDDDLKKDELYDAVASALAEFKNNGTDYQIGYLDRPISSALKDKCGSTESDVIAIILVPTTAVKWANNN